MRTPHSYGVENLWGRKSLGKRNAMSREEENQKQEGGGETKATQSYLMDTQRIRYACMRSWKIKRTMQKTEQIQTT